MRTAAEKLSRINRMLDLRVELIERIEGWNTALPHYKKLRASSKRWKDTVWALEQVIAYEKAEKLGVTFDV